MHQPKKTTINRFRKSILASRQGGQMNSYQQQLDKFLVTPTMTWKEASCILRALDLASRHHAADLSGDDRKTISRICREIENEMDECVGIMQRVKAT